MLGLVGVGVGRHVRAVRLGGAGGQDDGALRAIASAISIWVMCAMRCSILPPSAGARRAS